MPLYEYTCGECGSELELLVRGAETPACTECHGTQLTRRLSVPAAHVAGSSLPVCEAPRPRGGCGTPGCGPGGCGTGF